MTKSELLEAPKGAQDELQESTKKNWWIFRRALPDGMEYWLHTPRPRGLVFHEWKVRARLVASLGTDRDYVFPAPRVSDPLVYQESKHGSHDDPNFSKEEAPFWANLTTNRRALSAQAYRDLSTVEEAANG